MKLRLFILWGFLFCGFHFFSVYSQTEVELLMKEQDSIDSRKTVPVIATFESTRLEEGHSVEVSKNGNLDFRISHRFGRIDQGFYDWFGMDYANIRFGFDYGINNRWMVGLGRSSLDKEFDFYTKYKVLQQTTGEKEMPVSLSVLGELMIKTLRSPDGQSIPFDDKLSTAAQLLLARKFSGVISAQIMPIWVHYEKTPMEGDPNDIFSVGLGTSIRFTKRMRLNVEYYPLFSGNKISGTVSPLTVGCDIETGGHVFQLFVSNSVGTNERLFVTQTYDRWDKGQLHIGFNILRVFSLKHR